MNVTESTPRPRRSAASALAVAALAAAGPAGAAEGLSFLDPHGPVAAAQRIHLLEVVGLLCIVVVPVLVLTPLLAWRYRYGNEKARYLPNWEFSWAPELLVWAVPVIIVGFLSATLLRSTKELDPYAPLVSGDLLKVDDALSSGKPPLRVQVVGTDWKWLFIYPDQGIATVGEMAFPTDRQLALELTSMTAIQSFFIPALGSQTYAMGGMANRLHLAADRPGDFLGENTQYNGAGFVHQKFVARAMAPDDFDAWTGRVRDTGAALDDDALSVLTTRNTTTEARERLPGAGDVPGALYFDAVPERLFARLMAHSRTVPAGHVEPGALPGANAVPAMHEAMHGAMDGAMHGTAVAGRVPAAAEPPDDFLCRSTDSARGGPAFAGTSPFPFPTPDDRAGTTFEPTP